jgi:hypothetical protein
LAGQTLDERLRPKQGMSETTKAQGFDRVDQSNPFCTNGLMSKTLERRLLNCGIAVGWLEKATCQKKKKLFSDDAQKLNLHDCDETSRFDTDALRVGFPWLFFLSCSDEQESKATRSDFQNKKWRNPRIMTALHIPMPLQSIGQS